MQYLIGTAEESLGNEEQELFIVDAASPAAAREKYARQVGIAEPHWLEYVYGHVVGNSFADNFWLQTEAEHQSHYNAQLKPFSEDVDGGILIDQVEFERRVRLFFGGQIDFAEHYLDFMWNTAEVSVGTILERGLFPTEMLVYMWLHDSSWVILSIIPLAEIQKLS